MIGSLPVGKHEFVNKVILHFWHWLTTRGPPRCLLLTVVVWRVAVGSGVGNWQRTAVPSGERANEPFYSILLVPIGGLIEDGHGMETILNDD